MRLRTGAGLLALILVPTCAWPQADSSKPTTSQTSLPHLSFDGYLVTTGYYDDNVFNYSPTDIALIGSAADTSERFPISSVDDYVLQIAVRTDAINAVNKRTSWRARLRYDANVYARNTSRSHQQFGAELRWDHRRTYAEMSALWLPNYYVRELYWRPMPSRPSGVRYAPGEYDRYSLILETGTRFARGLHGHVTGAYDRRDYKAPFDERDNSAYTIGAGLEWDVVSRVHCQGRGYFCSVSAAAASSLDSLASDISNDQYGGEGGVELELDGRGRWQLNESVYYEHQRYTTGNPVDRFHYGRLDDEWGWGSQMTWRFHPHWQTRVFYDFRTSKTSEKVATDEGAFTGNRVGLQTIWYF